MTSDLHLQSYRIENTDFEEEYLSDIPALNFLDNYTFRQPVTFFVGENGTGKSTLLEALAICCGFNPEGGTRNFNFATEETHSTLYQHIRISRGIPFPNQGFFLRAESFYNVASEVDRLYGKKFVPVFYGGKSLHEQSHGESFMALMLNRFGENSIYFLDEPEAALSPSRQMAFIAKMHELVRVNCQFIIATHSPIIMAYPAAEIIQFADDSAKVTPYQETEHYNTTKHFLNHTDNMLHYLLEE